MAMTVSLTPGTPRSTHVDLPSQERLPALAAGHAADPDLPRHGRSPTLASGNPWRTVRTRAGRPCISTPISVSAQHAERENIFDRAATVRGRWLPGKTLFLDNKIYRSRPGYHVLTPLQLSGSEVVVLVNRGWILAPRLRSEIPLVSSPVGEIEISGVTRGFATKTFELQKTSPAGAGLAACA
jgi:hypothetical protein